MKNRHQKPYSFKYEWLNVESDIPISENQMSRMCYIIEEALFWNRDDWGKNVAKKIYKELGDKKIYVTVKCKRTIFSKNRIKAIVKIKK